MKSDSDMVIITCDSVQELQNTGVLDRVKNNTNDGIITIFSEIEGIEEMKSRLQMRGDSVVKNIFFSREKSVKDSAFENNLYYGLVSGTVDIPHITVMNKSLKSSLKTIVSKMSPKNGCISAIFMAKSVPAIILHYEDTKRIDYFLNCTD